MHNKYLIIHIPEFGCLPERDGPRLCVPVHLFSFGYLLCFMIVCLFYVSVLLEEFFVCLVWLTITMFMLLRHLKRFRVLLLLVFSTADSNGTLHRV